MVYAYLNDVPFRAEPHNISWDFKMKVKETKTLGGKVIQILGTTLGDMTVVGQFGHGPKSEGGENWADQIRFRTQIIKAVRTAEKQSNPKALRFRYTPRNWDFQVFVKSMTQTVFTNQDTAPEYTLVFSVDEEGSGSITKGVTDMYLSRLMDGVGWKQTDYNGIGDEELQGLLQGGTVGDYLAKLAQEVFESGLPGGQIGGTTSAGTASTVGQ